MKFQTAFTVSKHPDLRLVPVPATAPIAASVQADLMERTEALVEQLANASSQRGED